MKQILMLCWLIPIAMHGNAQDKEKITYDQVKTQCASLPLEKRARVSVTAFRVTTSSVNDERDQRAANSNNTLKALSLLTGRGGNAPKADTIPVTLGDNMATMLTSALQGINCFRILESLKKNEDLTGEIDQGNSKYSSKNVPKAGKQLGPQIVATGELTEYSVKSKGVNVMGVGASKKLVKIGFTLELINPETRDIVYTKNIRVQSKTSGSVNVFNWVSTENEDPAIAAVMEDGILQAVQCMTNVRDSLNITADNIPGNNGVSTSGGNEADVKLDNADYSSYSDLAGVIAACPGYKSMEKTLDTGVGDYTVTTTGLPKDFLEALAGKVGIRYQVIGIGKDTMEIKVKQ